MPRRINLLPSTERVRTRTNYAALGLLLAAVIVVFGLGLMYYLLSSSRDSLKDEVDELVQQRITLQNDVNALSQYQVLAQRRIAMEETVRGVYAGRTLLSEVLYDLSRAIQQNVWLTSLNLAAPPPGIVVQPAGGALAEVPTGALQIRGNTYSFHDISEFMVRLELVESLVNISVSQMGPPLGSVDPSIEVRGFGLSAGVVNTQDADTPLPVSKVEVEGL